jgi:hypothetical protein
LPTIITFITISPPIITPFHYFHICHYFHILLLLLLPLLLLSHIITPLFAIIIIIHYYFHYWYYTLLYIIIIYFHYIFFHIITPLFHYYFHYYFHYFQGIFSLIIIIIAFIIRFHSPLRHIIFIIISLLLAYAIFITLAVRPLFSRQLTLHYFIIFTAFAITVDTPLCHYATPLFSLYYGYYDTLHITPLLLHYFHLLAIIDAFFISLFSLLLCHCHYYFIITLLFTLSLLSLYYFHIISLY